MYNIAGMRCLRSSYAPCSISGCNLLGQSGSLIKIVLVDQIIKNRLIISSFGEVLYYINKTERFVI